MKIIFLKKIIFFSCFSALLFSFLGCEALDRATITKNIERERNIDYYLDDNGIVYDKKNNSKIAQVSQSKNNVVTIQIFKNNLTYQIEDSKVKEIYIQRKKKMYLNKIKNIINKNGKIKLYLANADGPYDSTQSLDLFYIKHNGKRYKAIIEKIYYENGNGIFEMTIENKKDLHSIISIKGEFISGKNKDTVKNDISVSGYLNKKCKKYDFIDQIIKSNSLK